MKVRWRTWLMLLYLPLLSNGKQIQQGDPKIAENACCSPNNNLNVVGQGSCTGHNSTFKLNCETGMFIVDPNNENFDIDEDGNLMFSPMTTNTLYIESGKFCVADRMEGRTNSTPVAIACFPDMESNLTYTVTGILSFTSVFFAVITFVVYLVVSELRDLQGKCTMCMLGCLALGYSHLASAQLFINGTGLLCVINGFLTYFWMLAVFFWMNVVSLNVMISVVFKNIKISDLLLFAYYTIYGWGCPMIFLTWTLVAHKKAGDHLKPGFGNASCWFSGNVETWAFFYGPMAVLVALNIIYFLITSTKVWGQRNYDNVTKWKSMRYKFLLYLKLVVVMGISWIFEILGFVYESKHIIWFIADTVNCLQGLIFFLVLVLFRKRALKGLAARGVPMPCIKNPHAVDEECEDIVAEEEASPSLAQID